MTDEVPTAAPLTGLRVLDLTRFVSGSQATAALAALGADVVKIEVPPGGDPYRVQGTERAGDESVLFMSLNAGKRSVALDFRSPLAARAMDRLLAGVDFLVENARPGSLVRHQLSWEQVHVRYPRIVYGSISGYGDVGPDAARGGFDLILQAESGVMSVTGSPESGPVKVGAPVLDVGAGLSCALGLLAAHIERERTGVGRLVSSSLLEFALTSLGTVAASMFVSGEVPGLLGTHSPTFAPYGGFRTADGWIVLAGAGSEELWVRCCAVLGLADLPADPRFADNAARVRNRDELTTRFETILTTEPSAHWLALLAAEGVPASEVRDVAQVFSGPQPAALGAVQTLQHDTAGDLRVVSMPVRIDRAPLAYPSPPPRLGADTRAVLTEAGLAQSEIDQLVAQQVAIAL
ncbi:MAG: CoA transferase [Actinomycetota bacterium]